MMTRKDFKAIARIIKYYGIAESNIEFVYDLINELKELNPLFNATKFLKACRHHEK